MIRTLLVVCLALAGVLASNAHYAHKSHRAAAETVLRDYAAVAAEAFVERLASEIGYYGYYPIARALRGYERGAPRPERQALETSGDERLQRAASLVRTSFVFDAAAKSWVERPDELTEQVDAWLRERLRPPSEQELAARRRAMRDFTLVHWDGAGGRRSFLFTPAAADPQLLVGAEIDQAVLAERFAESYARGPLLPTALADGRATNDRLFVRIDQERSDHHLFSAGSARYDAGLTVERRFPAAYGGIGADLVLTVSIPRDSAAALVSGGLPATRLPMLLGLLAACAGLVVGAIVLVRREQALQELRSEFVSRASHELRTPLTQLRMFSETLLLDRVRSDAERRRALEILDQEARRLAHLVENLLQFSRKERRSLTVSREMRELEPLVRDVASGFGPLARSEGATLSLRVEPVRALVDSDAVRQILLNLLDNALKYGSREQTIEIGLAREKGNARLWVQDEGPGVPTRDRIRIFGSFARLEAARRSNVAGTGIGLALVKELSKLHAGDAWVEDGPGGGARFVVELAGAESGS